MRRAIGAGLTGFVFAIGLGLAGMTRPEAVIGFLDITGDWQPALALVMVGAIGVHAIGWAVARRMARPVLGDRFVLPAAAKVDLPLVAGAAVFGVGWGLSGACPGPAVVNLATGSATSVLFVASMTVGMVIADHVIYPRVRLVRRRATLDDTALVGASS